MSNYNEKNGTYIEAYMNNYIDKDKIAQNRNKVLAQPQDIFKVEYVVYEKFLISDHHKTKTII